MKCLDIKFEGEKRNYKPRETIHATAEWNLDNVPKEIEAHLLWHTEGKGSQDSELIESVKIPSAALSGKHKLEMRLPDTPYSYHGTLISIIWALELVVDGDSEVARETFYLSPSGEAIKPREELGTEKDDAKDRFSKRKF